jgi:large subunit ribosomal protein L10
MKRATKTTQIAELRERFTAATLCLLTEYRGLKAGELDSLRQGVRSVQGEYRVAKNTLAKRALEDTDAQALVALLAGPTAVVFGSDDPVVLAKVVVRFADDHKALSIKGAVLDGQFLTPEAIKELAELPGREELLSRLLAMMQAPATQLVRTINEPAAQLARVVDAVRAKLEGEQPGGA